MVIIKKRNIFNVIFCCALVLSLGLNFVPENTGSTETSAAPVCGQIIIIDPGHGSPDGGAVSKSGTLEKDLNLQVAKELGSLLQQSGAYVLYTREDDNSVADDLNAKIREIKRSDMKNRKYIKNNSNAQIFVSIHMNNFEDSTYSGAQVFYDSNSDESKILASCIQTCLRDYVDNTNTREIKDSKNSIFILKDSTCPSVLVECGFLSNTAEEQKLKDKLYQQKLAYAIYCGVSQYLSN